MALARVLWKGRLVPPLQNIENPSAARFVRRCRYYASAATLRTYLSVDYSEKVDPARFEGLQADDIMRAIAPHMAPGLLLPWQISFHSSPFSSLFLIHTLFLLHTLFLMHTLVNS